LESLKKKAAPQARKRIHLKIKQLGKLAAGVHTMCAGDELRDDAVFIFGPPARSHRPPVKR
jgi:hypothetical protein